MSSCTSTLLPFVITGVIVGILARAGRGLGLINGIVTTIVPLVFGMVDSSNGELDLQTIWDAFGPYIDQYASLQGNILDWLRTRDTGIFSYTNHLELSATSNYQLSRVLRGAFGPRYLLISALQKQGWDGLYSIATTAVTYLGSFSESSDERLYIYQFLSFISIELVCRSMDIICSPDVLVGLATDISSHILIETADFSRPHTTTSLLGIFPSAYGRLIIEGILYPLIYSLAPLTSTVMRATQEDFRAKTSFQSFAKDPTSFGRYTNAEQNRRSVKDYMEQFYPFTTPPPVSTQQSSFRILTVSRYFPGIYRGTNNDSIGVSELDLEAGECRLLDHDEIKYLVAVIVATLKFRNLSHF